MSPEVEYLGHKIDQEGLHPTEEKLRAVKEAPEPQNKPELKSYLGLINYHGKFLPNLSTTSSLYRLLQSLCRWKWASTGKQTFLKSKALLTLIQRNL